MKSFMPLSYGQEALWFIYRNAPSSSAYNMGLPLQFTESPNPALLKKAVACLYEQHSALRSCITEQHGDAFQIFSAADNNYWQTVNALGWNDVTLMEQVYQYLQQPFELEKSVFRATLFAGGESGCLLLLALHHIAGDATSLNILGQQLITIYESLLENGHSDLTISNDYSDYVEWEKSRLDSNIGKRTANYWQKQLSGDVPTLQLPTDFSRPAVQTFNGSSIRFNLSSGLTDSIKTLAKNKKTTAFSVLLSVYQLLLHRYSGQSAIWTAVPTATPRTLPSFKNMVGYLVSPMIVKADFNTVGEMTFSQLLDNTSKQVLSGLYNQPYPFTQLVKQLQPQYDPSYPPLVQTIFAVEQQELVAHQFSSKYGTVIRREVNQMEGQFDLSLTWSDSADGTSFTGVLSYNKDLFKPTTIQRMAQHLEQLLNNAVANPETPLCALSLLTTAEQQQLQAWNATDTAYPQDQTIVSLFEAQVARTPENTAVVFEQTSLTYAELNARANQLAHTLIGHGITADTLVGICVERSLEMVIGLLAILKAGGAYVPLDPAYPAERLAFMLEDSQVPLLLTQTHLQDSLPITDLSPPPQVLCVDNPVVYASQPDSNPPPRSQPQDLAYVIYTSGSTGKPKGVMVTRGNLANFLGDMQQRTGIQEGDGWLAVTTLSFDIAALELYLPLISGSQLFLVSRDTAQDSFALQQALLEHKASFMQATPATWQMLRQGGWLGDGQLTILCGGEALPPDLGNYLQASTKYVWNVYGPTETTVWSTAYQLDSVLLTTPSIGSPIANTHIYILDNHLQTLPPGIPGELCIAGAGLARGYLNRPELTAEKFVEVELFGKVERVYRTGDLARWLPDGNLEYLGRIDHQVKLRGFRIELGEIEAVLAQHPAVGTAAVVLHEREGNKSLAAYVVAAGEVAASALDTATLRHWVAEHLPEYMVPASFTVLESMPLTPNGKIDRKALPAPDSLAGLATAGVALRTPTEQLLATLWAGVLKLDSAALFADAQFFALGGHSLLATQLAARVRTAFAVELPLRVVFAESTLSAMAAWLDAQQRGVAMPVITPLPADAVPPLSFAQQRLWFLSQLEGQSATYNMPAALQLHGQLDVAALRHALHTLVVRHTSLRQCFPAVDGAAMVRDLPAYDPLQVVDLRHLPEAEQSLEVQHRADADATAAFDLGNEALLRAQLLVLANNRHVLLLNMHHIISDGWSIGVLLREWNALYREAVTGIPANLPALAVQYGDYAAWQRQWLQGEVLEQQRTYWAQQLAGLPALLELPTDFPRPAVQNYRGAQLTTQLDTELTAGLHALAQSQGCTLFMLLLAAFQTLLHRYSQQDDVCVGSPIANRTQAQTEGLIGFFVNTLVLRAHFTPELRFTELLSQVRQTALGAYAHQDIPFEQLVEQLNPARSLSHSPLFQVMLVLQNNEAVDLNLPEVQVETLPAAYPVAKFDLTLSVQETPTGLACHWEYATALFREDTLQRMAEHLDVLLRAITAQPDALLHTLPLLTAAEQQQLQAWNATDIAYPQDQTIVSLFEAQVARTPENTAVVFEQTSLTYAELNARANRLAHTLIKHGITADTLVGICVERSLEMVIGLLAILKAGGAYVPLDPAYPAERLAFMLGDSQVNVLLTQTQLVNTLPVANLETPPHLLCLDDPTVYAAAITNPTQRSQPDNLAYVIYTSGSTGKPKGVLVEQHSLSNLCHWHQQAFAVTAADRASQVANTAFDAAAWEIWPYLLAGSCLYLAPRDLPLQPECFAQWLQANQITIGFLPTPLAENFLALMPENSCLRVLLTGGDQLKRYPEPQLPFALFNNYGPTENTVVTSCTAIPTYAAHEVPQSLPSIGQPIANTRIYLLDQHLQPIPLGVPGELCIAGKSLARGYLNRPELTAEKFIEVELFGKLERVYRTGDLARWLPDGNLEYLGRIDHQIKLRGFRIELGEIEAVLLQHPSVCAVAVLLREQATNPSLAAYVASTNGIESVDTSALRSWVTEHLPEYMVPASFTVLEHIPLTPNGKIDRKALPEPDQLAGIAEQGHALSTTTEHLLATLWASVLQVDAAGLGAAANFFHLGGHSLLATQLAARVHKAFTLALPLRVIFAHPQLGEMAAWLDTQQHTTAVPAITRLPQDTPPPLSFAQQRLWFLAQMEGQSATYNMPFALRLDGQLNLAALRHACQTLVQRHAALRQCFPAVNGNAVVDLLPAYDPLTVTNLSDLALPTQAAQVQRLADANVTHPFAIAHDALLRLNLLVLNEQAHVLLFNMHHIIGDGWSMGVLLKELSQLYADYSMGIAPQLPALSVQYGDYAAWQRQWLQGAVLATQRDYWAQQLAGIPELLALPTDLPRPAEQNYQGATVHYPLDAALSANLQSLAQAQDCTLFMLLLAAFQTLLHRYSHQDDVCVGSPIANRTQAQTEGLIGLFVNTLVLRAQIQPNMPFTELLEQVRHTAVGAYAHQELPFEHIVEYINPQRSLSHAPLFQVMFALEDATALHMDLRDLQATPLVTPYPIAKFDLTLTVQTTATGLECHWEYATALFQAETIARMAEHFTVMLQAIVAQPDAPLQTLPLLTAAEQQQLTAWNATETDYPQDQTIVSLFEAQATRTPQAIAVVCGEQQLTYQALNAQANYLANNLLALGVQPDTIIGICVDRSLATSIALLGVLKAGAAYLPLDPNYPAERLSYMLEHAQVNLLLTQSSLAPRFATYHNLQVLHLDNMGLTDIPLDYAAPMTTVQPEHLAYVIYTSGSTGLPKGVMLPQRALVNRALALADRYALEAQDRVLQFAAFSFDVAAEEMFPTWLRGACVVVAPRDVTHSITELVQFVQQQQVNVLNLPAPYWHEWVAQLSRHTVPASVRLVIAGSDKVLKTALQRWQQHTHHRVPVYCGYGPTEATITATLYTEQNADVGLTDSVLIGRPLPDTQTYILDRHLQPVPIGVPGELHIGGVALARGYLHAADLTAEKFIANPFQPNSNARLYKTGDLARYLPDGNIEFLGRMDEQVKIRGFRIELGEITAVLRQHTAVQDAVVVAKNNANGQQYLVAYLVPNTTAQVIAHPALKGQTLASSTDVDAQTLQRDLRQFMQQQLPDYMIPTTFMLLPALPLSPSGKLDLRALPEPEIQPVQARVALRTPTEQALAGIWRELLTVEDIGGLDNFFELGGNSLLITRLLHAVQQTFKVDLPVRALFDYPTLAAFAEYIDQHQAGAATVMTTSVIDFQAEVTLDDDMLPPTTDFKVAAHTLRAIFLTGATGFVGAFLLQELLQQTPAHIHCLVRANDETQGLQRLQQALQTHGLWQDHYQTRLIPVLGDLSLPRFGLSDSAFDALASQVDVIYHNGAWVNHVYPYSVLKAANVGGTQEAIRLACRLQTKPLHFISSQSVFPPDTAVMLEDSVLAEPERLGNGYVETKWVADKLVSLAGQRGLPVTIHRVSGVAGMLASGGFAFANDNFYRAVLTATQLNIAPDDPQRSENFVPADYACRAMVYLSSQPQLMGKTFHVGNPHNTAANLSHQALQSLGYNIRVLPMKTWLMELIQQAKDDTSIGLHPLLALFQQHANAEHPPMHPPLRFDMRNTLAGLTDSGIHCPAVNQTTLARYFNWLAQHGYLPLPESNTNPVARRK